MNKEKMRIEFDAWLPEAMKTNPAICRIVLHDVTGDSSDALREVWQASRAVSVVDAFTAEGELDQVEALRKDADRFRWLITNKSGKRRADSDGPECPMLLMYADIWNLQPHRPPADRLVEAIDAALSAKAKPCA